MLPNLLSTTPGCARTVAEPCTTGQAITRIREFTNLDAAVILITRDPHTIAYTSMSAAADRCPKPAR